jgi:CYTH domain-containing protein
MTSQHIGKYACLELERRFLLRQVPPDLPAHAGGYLITDRYYPHTRMRLRRMQSLLGDETIYKLTQKYRAETQFAIETTITNLYLTVDEYHLFDNLPGEILQKRRCRYIDQERTYSIDIFERRHHGLILGEIEFAEKTDAEKFTLPEFAMKDVTGDSFFTGGSLAFISDEEFHRGLALSLFQP